MRHAEPRCHRKNPMVPTTVIATDTAPEGTPPVGSGRTPGGLRRRFVSVTLRDNPVVPAVLGLPGRLKVTQSALKTVTYKAASTAAGFVTTYVIVQSATTAAALSGIWLVAGPGLYFAHESAWNYFGTADQDSQGHRPARVTVPLPGLVRRRMGADLTVSRAAAKTLVWRGIATAADFSLVCALLGNPATAAAVSFGGLVVGSFVYFGHEQAWDFYNAARADGATADAATNAALPIPDAHRPNLNRIRDIIIGRPRRRPARPAPARALAAAQAIA